MTLCLPLAHALFVAGALLLAGTAFFGAAVLPRTGAGAADAARIRRLAAASLAGAAAGLVAWTLAETATLAGSLRGLPVVLGQTLFGHLVLAQAACLLLAGGLRASFARGAVPASLLLVAEAMHGHGYAMGVRGVPIVAAGVLHLFAAAVWVGALPALLLTIRLADLPVAARAARRFSAPGKLAVTVVAASALVQGVLLVGSPAALLRTRYGVLVLVKVALFALLLAGACLNRYRFAPALTRPCAAAARRRLVATILFQTACGAAAIMVSVVLGASTPGIDTERS